ncbi:hypothetical protein AMECASPLE_038776 [Ameca splendens]|uniref:Integrase zinc-binding domain-containing protein n=1 Tax=Ameca splendens TaxID=208324 RepID=A0ABV0YVJ1_9TELE
MALVHPIYMCTLNTELFLGGQDLLDRLAPLIDCHQDQLWVQAEVQTPLGASSKPPLVTNQVASLEEPKEPLRPSSEPDMGTSGTQLHSATQKTPPRCSHASFLCSLKNPGVKPHNPKVVEDVHLESMFIPEVLLAFWLENSSTSRELSDRLCQKNRLLTEAQHSHTLLLADGLRPLLKTARVCTSSVQIGIKQLSQAFSIVPTDQRGVTLAYAHYSPVGDHRSHKTTLHTLQQMAYCPPTSHDIQVYIQRCLTGCQFQPSQPISQPPLQRRGVTLLWFHFQTNWVEPAPKLAGGNKFLLTVTCSFIKSAPNDTVIPAAALLLNQMKFYIKVSSPRTELVSMSRKVETSA